MIRFLALIVLAGGCASMALAPVVIREPRPEQSPLAIGVHYPDEFRALTKVAMTVVSATRTERVSRDRILVGEASVKLFDDALSLLFARVVSVPAVTQPGEGAGGVAAVIEPRIVAVDLEFGQQEVGSNLYARATIIYAFTLYSVSGERLASWTVPGAGFANTSTSLHDRANWNVEQRSFDLALRDAAWNFTSGFRNVPAVRRWLDERSAR